MIGARDRRAVRVIIVRAGRDDPGGEGDQDEQDKQNRESGGERKFLFRFLVGHGFFSLRFAYFTQD